MDRFRNLSIRHKLTLGSLLISGLILLLSSSIFVIHDLLTLRENLLTRIQISADIIARNGAETLRFDYPEEAGKTLEALAADQRVLLARIYDREGLPYTTYRRKSPQERNNFRTLKTSLMEKMARQDFVFSDADRSLILDFLAHQEAGYLLLESYNAMLGLLERQDTPLSSTLRQQLLQLLQNHDKDLPKTLHAANESQEIGTHYLRFTRPIWSNSEKNQDLLQVGSLYLIVELKTMRERAKWYVIMATLIVIIAIFLSVILSQQLQKFVVIPIGKLAKLTRQVSIDKDYTLRGHYQDQDEIGVLFNGFNEMLEAIQTRDNTLEIHQKQLEQTVIERTAELEKLNQQLTYQAFHDALTNLPNRAQFARQLEQALDYAKHNELCMAILFVDLDRFKQINDTLGHSAGDRVLQEVAQRLLASTRQPEDVVARLGGDEFTVLLRNVKETINAGIVAEKIIRALATPFHFDGQELHVTPSIGISIYPDDGKDVASLMRNADSSMYIAKQQGRNNYQFYTYNHDAEAANHLQLENQLRHALEHKTFEVWYQPRFELSSGQLMGAEALLRWRGPDAVLVPPKAFIPLAEDTGLIIPIGEQVLRKACEDNLQWMQWCDKDAPELSVSVNLSARQFMRQDLLTKIGAITAEVGMAHQRLELELTESLIMPNAQETILTLETLNNMGIQISVDDFGTGYSSLSYLKRFPIDIIKIDRSFIEDIHSQTEDAALVTAIIAMAHQLNIKVVAEGVETPTQLEFLRKHQCDYVQGYLFGRAIPAEAFLSLLKNQETHIEQYQVALQKLIHDWEGIWDGENE